MGQAELPPSVLYGETEMDLAPYRRRTIALLRRYARASVEVGRLPSLLGREFFRTRVTSYRMGSFEDIVIFVADMEKAIEKLSAMEIKSQEKLKTLKGATQIAPFFYFGGQMARATGKVT
jgi:hypothetical protein